MNSGSRTAAIAPPIGSDVEAPARRTPRRVLVLGPPVDALGGVSSVLGVLLGRWDSERYAPLHVAASLDGPKRRKVVAFLRAARDVTRVLATGSADVMHVHFAARASFYRKSLFILLARAFRVPVVGHAHSGLFPGFYEAAGPMRRRFIRSVLGRMDRLVVLSEEWVEFYTPLYGRSEPVVIPNPTLIPPIVERDPGAAPVILSLGRLGKGKGTYDILEAAPAVLAAFPRAEFWLGGDGEVERVRALLADKPWGHRVRLLGWVAGEAKKAALRRATLFILPSYAEGLPMAVLEAMAHGLPVVATPVGGIPRAIADGETGVLVPPGDVPALAGAILDLLGDPARALAMGAAARRSAAERYDVSRIQERIASLYDDLLHRR